MEDVPEPPPPVTRTRQSAMPYDSAKNVHFAGSEVNESSLFRKYSSMASSSTVPSAAMNVGAPVSLCNVCTSTCQSPARTNSNYGVPCIAGVRRKARYPFITDGVLGWARCVKHEPGARPSAHSTYLSTTLGSCKVRLGCGLPPLQTSSTTPSPRPWPP